MKKKSFIETIRVENPCGESWNEMKGNDVVRFCSHCSKNVNDLSAMTPGRAAKLVRRANGRICVRYRQNPNTGLPLFAQKLHQVARTSGITAGVVGASIALGGGAAYAQGGYDAVAAVRSDQSLKTDGVLAKLTGQVIDPNGAVIPFALVSITNRDTAEYRTATASADGLYEISDITPGSYVVKIEAGGFEFKEFTDVYLTEGTSHTRDAQLGLPQIAAVVEVGGPATDSGRNTWVAVTVGDISITESRNPLVQAVLNDDLEEVKRLLAIRGKVNVKDKAYDGISPLHAAVENGNVEIAQFLLGRGAKVNMRDFLKRTPLMMLDEDASPEMFSLLLTYGAKLNLVDKEKNTVLHRLAAYDLQGEMIRMIANYGVNVNAVNREGKTALMIAAENESTTNIEALVRSGAVVDLTTRDGKTAWMLSDDPATRAMLETFGAVTGKP